MKGHICAKNLICNRLLSEKIAWKYVFPQKLFVFGFFNYRCKNKDLYWYSICKINLRSNEGKLFPQLKFPDLSVSSQLNDQTKINFLIHQVRYLVSFNEENCIDRESRLEMKKFLISNFLLLWRTKCIKSRWAWLAIFLRRLTLERKETEI